MIIVLQRSPDGSTDWTYIPGANDKHILVDYIKVWNI